MRQPERNSVNELRNFEPEVESAHIDQSWEKIKYFLPQERRRRKFFYLFFKGTALKISIAFMLLTLGVLSFLYFRRIETKEQVQSQFKGESPTKLAPSHKSLPAQPLSRLKTGSKQSNNYENKKTRFRLGSGSVGEQPLSEKQTAVLSSNENGKEIQRAKAFVWAKKRSKLNDILAKTLKDSSTLTEPTDLSETYFHLDPILVKNLSFAPGLDSLTVVLSFNDEKNFKSKFRNKIGIELLVGGNWLNTLWHLENSVSEQQQNRFGFFGNAGIVYSLRNKWNFNLGYTFIQNKTDFSFETSANKVVATETTVVSVSSFVPDTVYKYFRVSSNTKVTSAGSSLINLGVGYTLLQQRKIALEVLLQMSVRSAVYSVHTLNQVGTDTLLYVRTQGKPALESLAGTGEGDKHSRERLRTYGFTSGFNLVYAINPKTSFLFRPAFFLPLSTSKVKTAPGFEINQKNWFIGVGIRRYLGG